MMDYDRIVYYYLLCESRYCFHSAGVSVCLVFLSVSLHRNCWSEIDVTWSLNMAAVRSSVRQDVVLQLVDEPGTRPLQPTQKHCRPPSKFVFNRQESSHWLPCNWCLASRHLGIMLMWWRRYSSWTRQAVTAVAFTSRLFDLVSFYTQQIALQLHRCLRFWHYGKDYDKESSSVKLSLS